MCLSIISWQEHQLESLLSPFLLIVWCGWVCIVPCKYTLGKLLYEHLAELDSVDCTYDCIITGKSKEAEIKRINKELANIRSKFKGKLRCIGIINTYRRIYFVPIKNKINYFFCLDFKVPVALCQKKPHTNEKKKYEQIKVKSVTLWICYVGWWFLISEAFDKLMLFMEQGTRHWMATTRRSMCVNFCLSSSWVMTLTLDTWRLSTFLAPTDTQRNRLWVNGHRNMCRVFTEISLNH